MKPLRACLFAVLAGVAVSCVTREERYRDEVNGARIESMRLLASAANGIDNSATSLAAYARADSLLNLAAGAGVYESETFLNAALTEIWFGMSYSGALYAAEATRGQEEAYLMEYLDEVVEQPLPHPADSLEELAMQDINSLYAVLNGYLLTRPEVYSALIDSYAQYHYAAAVVCDMDSIDEWQTYRLLRLNTRNAYFEILAPMVVDTYALLHDYDDSLRVAYTDRVVALGHELDEVPCNLDEVKTLPDSAFWRYNAHSAGVCARLTVMLARNVEEIRDRQLDYSGLVRRVYLTTDDASSPR